MEENMSFDTTVSLSKENILNIKEFMNGPELVELMNEAGLQFEEMAFIVQKLFDAINDALDYFDNEPEDVDQQEIEFYCGDAGEHDE